MNIADIKTRLNGSEPKLIEIRKNSAVLLPLVETEEGLSILFEKRTSTISHAGETCFPGGAVDAGESFKDAVVREVSEEIGLSEGTDYELAGQYAKFALITGMCVNIFVGILKPEALSKIKINPDEVAEVFTIPVDFLLKEETVSYDYKLIQAIDENFPRELIGLPEGYRLPSGKVHMPVWAYRGHVLFGMTARMVKAFLNDFAG